MEPMNQIMMKLEQLQKQMNELQITTEKVDAFISPNTPSREVKIYKSANKKSTLDVTSMLSGSKMYNKNKHEEFTYKGKIIIGITEHGKDYEKAYLSKGRAKVILSEMLNHTFSKRYGVGFSRDNGVHIHGGSVKDGKVRGRILSIFYTDRNQYVFQIEEGPAEKTETGAFKLKKKERKVQKFLSLDEALEMAHEVKDYIGHEEMVNHLRGAPLYDILPTEYPRAVANT
ncbi:hypothetical protein BpOF4_20874 (plasmid) [Alkalihalophilus pseudofirmus OF4]|uniref:Uncharacterized protein n=1 Tax=Alkalihalophilus pseudofirmus (strain ATCC BAA-2126 / JCM 17055 / OF4) TaxID=398511 RepID=D3G1E4_ALKPO|nr:hypothetical protein [Alkalihalophilus pseudofirmus]ADC52170.1 hypothetical protein BpOF4_20874 [Alkalihalophilus pseudofirmus OF4]